MEIPAIKHNCAVCRELYDCEYCTKGMRWACSTVNDDEDANMCDPCLERFASEYTELYLTDNVERCAVCNVALWLCTCYDDERDKK